MASALDEREELIDTFDTRELIKNPVKSVIDCPEYYILQGAYDFEMHHEDSENLKETIMI